MGKFRLQEISDGSQRSLDVIQQESLTSLLNFMAFWLVAANTVYVAMGQTVGQSSRAVD